MSETLEDSKVELAGTPVDRVLRVFSMAEAGAIAGVTSWAIEKWKDRGGGLVPAKHQQKYLAAAKEMGRELSAQDLIGEAR
jgi:hypothetical protein